MRIYRKRRGNRFYLYGQESYRVPGRKSPKTRSWYIGPEDGLEREARALAVAERFAAKMDAWQRENVGETGAERKAREAEEARFKPAEFLEKTQSTPAEQSGGGEANQGEEKSPAD